MTFVLRPLCPPLYQKNQLFASSWAFQIEREKLRAKAGALETSNVNARVRALKMHQKSRKCLENEEKIDICILRILESDDTSMEKTPKMSEMNFSAPK